MSAGNSNLAKTKALLQSMVSEANDLKRTAGGSITDAVADWLAPQYLLAAREKLAATDGTRRFEVLRTFVQDWAMLRHGDHTAERLHIERERLKLEKRTTNKSGKRKFKPDWITSRKKSNTIRRSKLLGNGCMNWWCRTSS